MNKYEFTGKTFTTAGWLMHEIRALKDFDDVKAGDLGGYIYNEKNLSQRGTCWVYPGSTIENNARVTGNAKVKGKSRVRNSARVYGNAVVDNDSDIFTAAKIYGDAYVSGVEVARSEIFGYAHVEGHGIGCNIDSGNGGHILGPIVHSVICDHAYVYLEEMNIYGRTIKGDTKVVLIKEHEDTLKAIEQL